mmetsp:Transcript_7800/g.16168  ORF Transcript_7800/g.16168 Transcript_7800/m.16168 type:complete len:265 (-) Transcript_7800:1242-2036(-)
MLDAAQGERHKGGSQPQKETQKGHAEVIVVLLTFQILVMFVIGIEVVHQPHLARWIANRVEDENANDQKGKDLVRKARGVLNESIQIQHGRQDHVKGHPQTHPSVKGQKGHVPLDGQFVNERLKGEDRAGTAVDHHGHARHEGIKDAAKARSQQEFDRAHVIVGAFRVHGAKGDGGSNHGNEQKERHGNGFKVEILDFVPPVRADGRSKVLDNALAPSLRRFVVVVRVNAAVVTAAVRRIVVHGASTHSFVLKVATRSLEGCRQ